MRSDSCVFPTAMGSCEGNSQRFSQRTNVAESEDVVVWAGGWRMAGYVALNSGDLALILL